MRIVVVHPNYHSGGAEIAGNWPPAWASLHLQLLQPVEILALQPGARPEKGGG